MNEKLANVLFILRVTVAIVFVMWTGDKFINPVHAQNVWQGFFYMPRLGNALFLGIGIVEAILIILFVAGLFKSITYLMILALHTISTLAPYKNYLNAYESDFNLLFFGGFPMWGACLTLYVMREYDIKFTFR